MNTERSTKTKQAVISLLQGLHTPLLVAEIFDQVQKIYPKTAYSTIFRIITALEEAGKVNRIDWRERGSRYEWADHPHHHHIVCQLCGCIEDIDDNVLNFSEPKIAAETGYLVKHHAIELEGICPKCQVN